MRLNPSTSLYLVDPVNGEITNMSLSSFHHYLTGSHYTSGPFEVEVYTDKEEANIASSVYTQAHKIHQQLVQIIKNKDANAAAANALASIQSALDTMA